MGLLFVTICQHGVTALTCEATEGDLICFEMNYKYSAAILSYPSWCRGCGQGCSLLLRAVIDGNHVFSYQSCVEGSACCGGQRAASSGAYPTLPGLGPLDVTVLVFKWIVNFLALLSNSVRTNFHKECMVLSVTERLNSAGVIFVQVKS